MSPLTWLATEATPSPTPRIPPGRLTEVVDEAVGNELVTWFVRVVLEPSLRILLIIVLSWLVVRVAKAFIRRTVEEIKEPDEGPDRFGRVKRKLSLGEGRSSYSLRKAQRADALGALFSSITAAVIWTIAVFTILAVFGIDLGPLIAGAGIVGVALGFGAQDLVKDFLSGVFMLVEDQYGVGDVVDAGEASGVVEGVSLRTTRLRDVTGTLWHIPNGEIRRIGNMSQEWARALLDIGIAYGADVDEAAGIIMQVAESMAEEDDYRDIFLAHPEIWGVEALGNDSVVIRLVVKTKPGEQWAISRELRRRVKVAFDDADVEIPFPQRTVWLRTDDAAVAKKAKRRKPKRDPSAPSPAQGKAAAEEGAGVTSDDQTETPSPLDAEEDRSS